MLLFLERSRFWRIAKLLLFAYRVCMGALRITFFMDNPKKLWNNTGWFVPNARKLNHLRFGDHKACWTWRSWFIYWNWLFWETAFTTWTWHRRAAGACRSRHPSDGQLLDISWKLQTIVTLLTTFTLSMQPWGTMSSWGRCGMKELWNHLSKQALDKRRGACCLQSQSVLLRDTMRWLFHGRTMSRRCSAAERPLKTDSALLRNNLNEGRTLLRNTARWWK